MAHPLQRHIDETGDTVAAFASRVGVEADALEAIMADQEPPTPALARRIVEATGGAISFEQLIGGRQSVVVDLATRRTVDTDLDLPRLAQAIAAALSDFAPVRRRIRPTEFEIGAEAVAHTYAALARLTTEIGAARLAQALRPVLQEILKDHGGLSRNPADLEAAVQAAAERYYRI